MMSKLKRKGDASAATLPKASTPGSSKLETEKLKKRRLVKANPEKPKAAAVESAATAEASASTPALKTVEVPEPAEAAPPNGMSTESNRGDSNKKEMMKGREDERGEGKDNKTSRKEVMKGREEQGRDRKEKRSRTMGKEEEEEDGDRCGTGFIFMCNTRTKPECYRNGVFGHPRGKMDVVEKIRPGAKLFLYDFDLKLMYGVYKATTRGGLDLVRHAFDGKFPAQVKFSVDLDCVPVPESSFKHAIKENYNSKGRFTQELSSKQVHMLLALFKPIGVSQPPPHHIEDMCCPHTGEDRQESYVYDERRPSHHVDARGGPINVHASLLEDRYKITPSLHRPLPSEPRHSLMLDHHQTPIGIELRHALASHHVPLTQELQQVPPMYYHQVVHNSSNHQTDLDTVHERTAAEATVRDPPLSRDYGALSGDLVARTERLDELYRSYKLSTRAMDIHQDPSIMTTSYENPRSTYNENVQTPVSTRVSGPSVSVSARYSFPGPPSC